MLSIVIIFIGSLLAGFIGALTGLGGGIIIIPMLTLILGYHMNYAIGAALVSVIATSTGAATVYIKEGITNINIGYFLLIATTIGAIIGALIGSSVSTNLLSILFGLILAFTAIMTFVKKQDHFIAPNTNKLANNLELNGTYVANGKTIVYEADKPIAGFFMMVFAGVMSGMLGIGSGVLKVIAMDTLMKLPFKVSTSTSSFMIGVTAIASALIYLQKGYIVANIAAPVFVGVFIGASIGAKLLPLLNTSILKKIFALIVALISIQMIVRGLV